MSSPKETPRTPPSHPDSSSRRTDLTRALTAPSKARVDEESAFINARTKQSSGSAGVDTNEKTAIDR